MKSALRNIQGHTLFVRSKEPGQTEKMSYVEHNDTLLATGKIIQAEEIESVLELILNTWKKDNIVIVPEAQKIRGRQLLNDWKKRWIKQGHGPGVWFNGSETSLYITILNEEERLDELLTHSYEWVREYGLHLQQKKLKKEEEEKTKQKWDKIDETIWLMAKILGDTREGQLQMHQRAFAELGEALDKGEKLNLDSTAPYNIAEHDKTLWSAGAALANLIINKREKDLEFCTLYIKRFKSAMLHFYEIAKRYKGYGMGTKENVEKISE